MMSVQSAIPFVKATACGNDFLIIEGAFAGADCGALTRRICDRQRGIGADGVEWLYLSVGADIEARLVNADGSAAEISGNGTRCVAAYLAWKNSVDPVAILTGAGLRKHTLNRRVGNIFEFETAMGTPSFEPECSLVLSRGVVRGVPVSMGNPHYVVFSDCFSGTWKEDAAEIGHHPHFRHGVNVEMVLIERPNRIQVRFYERGVGETLSSGTGSCASAVAAIQKGFVTSPVEVSAPGGMQTVNWDGQVLLRGTAELVGRGEFFA